MRFGVCPIGNPGLHPKNWSLAGATAPCVFPLFGVRQAVSGGTDGAPSRGPSISVSRRRLPAKTFVRVSWTCCWTLVSEANNLNHLNSLLSPASTRTALPCTLCRGVNFSAFAFAPASCLEALGSLAESSGFTFGDS